MIAIYVNLNAASNRSKRSQLDPYIDYLNKNSIEFQLNLCENLEDLHLYLSQDIQKGIRNLFSYGGDGSLHHLLNAVYVDFPAIFQEIKFGLIPAGTGNDWIRNFTNDPFYSLYCFNSSQSRNLDIGKLTYKNGTEKLIFNLAGIGFNGAVIQRIDRYKFLGNLAYYFALVDTFFSYSSRNIKLKIDQESLELDAFMVSIGLGKYAGGNMKLCPEALLDDGLFDINIIYKVNLWTLLTNLSSLSDGSYLQKIHCRSLRAKSIEIIENNLLDLEGDGEFLGRNIAKIEIWEKGAEFLV